MNFAIELVKVSEITPEQQVSLEKLDKECFGDVPQEELQENFIAKPFVYLFAMVGTQVISRAALYKRVITFEKKSIVLGGIGGVCVTTLHRHHGIALSMLKRALVVLREEKCDIACLNVDLEKKVYGLYEKLGFKMMEREISFKNVKGELVFEYGTMFVSVCSPELYDFVMNSSSTFHYGQGYW